LLNKLSINTKNPLFIIVVAVMASQITSWSVDIIKKGIDEVRSGMVFADEGWALSEFEPFTYIVERIYPPYPREESPESIEMRYKSDTEWRFIEIESRLYYLDGKDPPHLIKTNPSFQDEGFVPYIEERLTTLEKKISSIESRQMLIEAQNSIVIEALRP